MTPQEFTALVARLQQRAQQRPRAYGLRVLLLALLGYAYILAALVLILLTALIHPLLLIGGIALAVIIASSLWVPVPVPKGLPLESHDAPRLFRAIEHIRESLHFPGFDRILLVDSFNAGITQIPRLGVFGWHRNYLLIGMPLLMGLSPEQFRAVLAHEFYHLFGGHSRFDLSLYRLRVTWNRLVENLERRRHRGAVLFRWFFDWYVPLLNAHTFVLARQHELGADRFAADLIGAQAMAEALLSLKLRERYLTEIFLPSVWRRAREQAEPPANLYTEMQRALRRAMDWPDALTWSTEAMAAETTPMDSHPSLGDRLRALRQTAALQGPIEETAAEHFFGPSLGALCEWMDADWRTAVSTRWHEQYQDAEASRRELRALEELAATRPLAEGEAARRAHCMEALYGSEAALPLYAACLEAFPDNAACQFALGRILLAKGDAAGVEHIERAMKLDADYALSGCELLYTYQKEAGRKEEAEDYAQRHRRRMLLLQDAQEQRTRLRPDDRFYAHDLAPEEVEAMRARLASYPAIAKAHLVRKGVTLLPERPHYILGITWRVLWPVWNSQKMITRLAREIPVPRGTMTFVHLGPNARLRRRIMSVPNSRIYKRPWFEDSKKSA
jgi:hypothetical protein